jgi:hypothetical protein
MGFMMGMFGKRRLHHNKEFSVDFIRLCLLGLIINDRKWWQRAACAALLDYEWPEWRHHVDLRIVGFVVERHDFEALRWRRLVLDRDNYECQKCGDEENLHAHHIVRWIDAPELRLIVANGITLCAPCHHKEHGWKSKIDVEID